MWDETHGGWLAGDDYEWAAARRGELVRQMSQVDSGANRAEGPVSRVDRQARFLGGRWEDSDPPGSPA